MSKDMEIQAYKNKIRLLENKLEHERKSLRDEFALSILKANLVKLDDSTYFRHLTWGNIEDGVSFHEWSAMQIYAHADAMMKAREKGE